MPKQNVPNSPLKNANNPKTQARFYAILDEANPPRFQVGDEITFMKADGWSWICAILGFREDGTIDAMTYDGNPHLLHLTIGDLEALRVVNIRTHDDETIDMYRRLVGLDIEGEAA